MLNTLRKLHYNFLNRSENHNIGPDYTKRVLKNDYYSIGEYTYGIPKIVGAASEKNKLVIGKFCSIGSGVQILLCANHRLDWITSYPLALLKNVNAKDESTAGKGDIVIGNDVWIGNNVTILHGKKIGDGAVLGAGSVVTSDVLPYEVIGGNPARHIKFRFAEDKIQMLLNMKWWDWPLEEIIKKSDYLSSPL